MNLEAWLKQDHSLADQLKVIEGLSRALNEAHARGVVHRALDPGNIEVESDGTCHLDGAVTGFAAPDYRAPELSEGGAVSPQSDIYSAGVICYEMLSGRTPSGERPTPLADLRSDVSRDLTDAVMGCLERGPDWRPKDLSYLLQVVGTLRSAGGRGGGRAPSRAAEPVRSAPRAGGPQPRRAAPRGGSRSNLPLVAAVAVLALAAGAGYWFYFKQSATGGQVASGEPEPTPSLPATPTPQVEATPTPGPIVATPKATPTARPEATPRAGSTPAPTPTPRVAAAATPEPRPTATPPPVVAAATPPPTPPPTLAPAVPALLATVSPLSIRRGGTTMLDLRGSGLRADHQARIVKVKEATNGISVVRQKYVDPTLIKVLVNLDANVAPGPYAVVLSDEAGVMTNTLPFTVAK